MADSNPAPALDVVRRIAMMCDFMEHPAVETAVEQAVPATMPRAPGALGFDVSLWVGLGTVGLWAALDGFSERATLPRNLCKICGKRCMAERFASYAQGNDSQSLQELEDLRHLYAHNYAGEADDAYFSPSHPRHVLKRDVAVKLSCGTEFNGRRSTLDLHHLREYANAAKAVLQRFS